MNIKEIGMGDMGREIVFTSMDIKATLYTIIDGIPWCVFRNSGTRSDIPLEDLKNWEYVIS